MKLDQYMAERGYQHLVDDFFIKNLKTLAASIEEYVRKFDPKTRIDWAIEKDEEHQAFKLRFDTKWDAIHSSILFDENFVTTPEFREL